MYVLDSQPYKRQHIYSVLPSLRSRKSLTDKENPSGGTEELTGKWMSARKNPALDLLQETQNKDKGRN
jgi:hypothetical protein